MVGDYRRAPFLESVVKPFRVGGLVYLLQRKGSQVSAGQCDRRCWEWQEALIRRTVIKVVSC